MEQQVFCGNKALVSLKKTLKEIDPKKILIVRGKGSYELSGAKELVKKIIEELDTEIQEFSEFTPNPDYNDIKKGLKLVDSYMPDLIIGIGGGSVIDTGKSLRFLNAYNYSPTKGEWKKKKYTLPMLAIPTTSGTGAECTKFAIYYKDKIKESLDHPEVVPDMVLLWPQLTNANSEYLTACCGFDAFAQAVEALWNKYTTEESDKYAKKALSLIVPNIKDAVKHPDEKNRAKMMEGAYWAGRAINITRTTAPHAFAYTFTSHYGYPHGHAVALTFPILAEINLNSGKVSSEKTGFILDTCGIAADSIKEEFTRFTHELGLAPKDVDYDIDLLAGGVNAGRLKNNPAEITPEIALKVVKDSLCK